MFASSIIDINVSLVVNQFIYQDASPGPDNLETQPIESLLTLPVELPAEPVSAELLPGKNNGSELDEILRAKTLVLGETIEDTEGSPDHPSVEVAKDLPSVEVASKSNQDS